MNDPARPLPQDSTWGPTNQCRIDAEFDTGNLTTLQVMANMSAEIARLREALFTRTSPSPGHIAPVLWCVACRECEHTAPLSSGPIEDLLMSEAFDKGWSKSGHRWLCPACGTNACDGGRL